jgi:hypothetical protein
MSAGSARRVLIALLGALAFGVVWSVLKGNASGIRDAAGNVSAPWVVLPLLAGAFAAVRRPLLGALIGLGVTFVALVAFYLTNAFVLDLGTHSTVQDVALTMRSVGNMWFRYGVASGIALGAGGAWLAGRRAGQTVGAVIAALLIMEPAAWLAWFAARGQSLSNSGVNPVVWCAELACGLALVASLCMRRGSRA